MNRYQVMYSYQTFKVAKKKVKDCKIFNSKVM